MKQIAVSLSTLALCAAALEPSSAPAAQALPCAATQIARMSMPSGPARYQSGRMTLRNGATLELSGPLKSAPMYRVSQMKVGDNVAACYGPPANYADAGPSRSITILDTRNGEYYGTLIGTWSP